LSPRSMAGSSSMINIVSMIDVRFSDFIVVYNLPESIFSRPGHLCQNSV
jgi:hypothetical protein